MQAYRVRTGVARTDDGWHVVVTFGEDDTHLADPPFATEAEAEAAARKVSAAFRASLRADGVPYLHRNLEADA